MFDTSAFEEIVRKYGKMIYKYCFVRLCGNTELTEETVNDVFVVLFRKWDRLDLTADVGPWLYRTADNLIKNALKMRAKTSNSEISLDTAFPDENGMASVKDSYLSDRMTDDELLKTVADRLPDRYRDVFVCRFIKEMTFVETAAATGIPYTSVCRRINEMGPLIRQIADEL